MRFANIAITFLVFIGVSSFAQNNGLYSLPDLNSKWSDADLSSLQSLVGDSRWVGLGEAAHTTETFSQAKFRIIKYMVENLGFRAIAFETGDGWRDAIEAENYVTTCKGSPANAVNALSAVWRGQSVEDLLQWLCQYNNDLKHNGNLVTFYSFDLQVQEDQDLAAIESLLTKLASSKASSLMSGLSTCNGFAYRNNHAAYLQALMPFINQTEKVSGSDESNCIAGLDQLDLLIAAQLVATKDANANDWKSLRVASAGVRGYQTYLFGGGVDEPRDRGMAQLIDYRHEMVAPNAKTIVWAHSSHLSLNASGANEVCPKGTSPGWEGVHNMGYFFSQTHGDYFPIALTGYQGSGYNYGQSIPWPIYSMLPPTAANSVELILHNQGPHNWLLDLRQSFLKRDQTYEVQDPGCQDSVVPLQQYRTIISFEQLDPMKCLDTGQCQAP